MADYKISLDLGVKVNLAEIAKAIKDANLELDTTSLNNAIRAYKTANEDFTKLQRAATARSVKGEVRPQDLPASQDISAAARDMKEAGKRLAEVSDNLARNVREERQRMQREQTARREGITYRQPEIIQPGGRHRDPSLDRLAKSLEDLQTTILKSVGQPGQRLGGTTGQRYQVSPRGFQLSETGRAYELKILDVEKLAQEVAALRVALTGRDVNVGALTRQDPTALWRELVDARKRETEALSDLTDVINKLAGGSAERRARLQEVPREQVLERYFKEILPREMQREFIRALSIPAVRTTPTGGRVVESEAGAVRAPLRFVERISGLEQAIKELAQQQRIPAARAEAFVERRLREAREGKLDIEEIFSKLTEATRKRGLAEALVTRRAETAAVPTTTREMEETQKQFRELAKAYQELDVTTLSQKAKEAGVTIQEAIDALTDIRVFNVYDIINRSIQETSRGSEALLSVISKNISAHQDLDAAARKFRNTVEGVLQISQLIPQEQPKRAAAIESQVAVLQRAAGQQMPEIGKQLVIELNEAIKRELENQVKTGKFGVGDIGVGPGLTSLGLSESMMAGRRGTGERILPPLPGKDIFMMTDLDLREFTPLAKELHNMGRTLSQTFHAMAGGEFPLLRAPREQEFIKTGRFGEAGFGYNVLTELRNTTRAFEDQIEISGKLANALTQRIEKLIVPAEGTELQVKPGDIVKTGQDIAQMLGGTLRYSREADQALVQSIQDTMERVRGEEVPVKVINVLETFIGQMGRKVTTRSAGKGVTIFDTLAENVQNLENIRVALKPEGTLGFAQMPKTISQLSTEMLNLKEQTAETTRLMEDLKEAGNLFVLTNERLLSGIDPDELRNRLAQALELPAVAGGGVGAIRAIRGAFQERVPGAELFERRPIEARVSAYGLAKRGLQADVAEALVNNLYGEIRAVLGKRTPEVEKELRQFLPELGYTGPRAGADFDKIGGLVKVMEDGAERFSLVGSKFLEIVEEPHGKRPFTAEQIRAGEKGIRVTTATLDALLSTFGPDSPIIREMLKTPTPRAEAGTEVVRAFLLTNQQIANKLEGLLREVRPSEIKTFKEGAVRPEEIAGTIFDPRKFATEFFLRLPARPGEEERKLFVPGIAARQLFPETLTGKVGTLKLGRHIQNIIDRAQEIEKLLQTGGEITLEGDDLRTYVKKGIQNLVNDALERGSLEAAAPEVGKLVGLLRPEKELRVENLIGTARRFGGMTEQQAGMEAFRQLPFNQALFTVRDILTRTAEDQIRQSMNNLQKIEEELKSIPAGDPRTSQLNKNLETIKRTIAKIERGEMLQDIPILDPQFLEQAARKLGAPSEVNKRDLENKFRQLEGSIETYRKELMDNVFGKEGSLDFSVLIRQIPAITATAVAAPVTKRAELETAQKQIQDLLKRAESGKDALIKSLGDDYVQGLRDSLEEIEKNIEEEAKLERKGVVRLRETEIGIPIKKAKVLGEVTGLDPGELEQRVVQSLRFPVTGAPSFKPFQARILREQFAQNVLTVPGRPVYEQESFETIARPLMERLDVLRTQRREAFGVEDERAASRLTAQIEELSRVIEGIKPKFTSFEQNLDFDGDKIFIHATAVDAAQKELDRAFQNLNDDILSTRNALMSFLSVVSEPGVENLEDVMKIFEKRFPLVPEIPGQTFRQVPQTAEVREEALRKGLTKLDVGMATESINRIASIVQATRGIDVKSVRGQDFEARLNELIRFNINKALQAKHGGGGGVGIAGQLASIEGIEQLMEGEFGNYFRQLDEVMGQALRDRLEGLSTGALMKEAQAFGVEAKGERDRVVDAIVEAAGFENFFKEIAGILESEYIRAYEVYINRQLKTELGRRRLAEEGILPAERVQEIAGMPAEARGAAVRRAAEAVTPRRPESIPFEISQILRPVYQARTGGDILSRFKGVKELEEVPEALLTSFQELSEGITAGKDSLNILFQNYVDGVRAELDKWTGTFGETLDIDKVRSALQQFSGKDLETVMRHLGVKDISEIIEGQILAGRDLEGTEAEIAELIVKQATEFDQDSAEAIDQVRRDIIIQNLEALKFRRAYAELAFPRAGGPGGPPEDITSYLRQGTSAGAVAAPRGGRLQSSAEAAGRGLQQVGEGVEKVNQATKDIKARELVTIVGILAKLTGRKDVEKYVKIVAALIALLDALDRLLPKARTARTAEGQLRRLPPELQNVFTDVRYNLREPGALGRFNELTGGVQFRPRYGTPVEAQQAVQHEVAHAIARQRRGGGPIPPEAEREAQAEAIQQEIFSYLRSDNQRIRDMRQRLNELRGVSTRAIDTVEDIHQLYMDLEEALSPAYNRLQEVPRTELFRASVLSGTQNLETQINTIQRWMTQFEERPPFVQTTGLVGSALHGATQARLIERLRRTGQPTPDVERMLYNPRAQATGHADILFGKPGGGAVVGDIKTILSQKVFEALRQGTTGGFENIKDPDLLGVLKDARGRLEKYKTQVNFYLGTLADQMESELGRNVDELMEAYIQVISQEDPEKGFIIQVPFERARYEQDIRAINEARKRARQYFERAGEGVEVPLTASLESLQEFERQRVPLADLKPEELARFANEYEEYYKQALELLRIIQQSGLKEFPTRDVRGAARETSQAIGRMQQGAGGAGAGVPPPTGGDGGDDEERRRRLRRLAEKRARRREQEEETFRGRYGAAGRLDEQRAEFERMRQEAELNERLRRTAEAQRPTRAGIDFTISEDLLENLKEVQRIAISEFTDQPAMERLPSEIQDALQAVREGARNMGVTLNQILESFKAVGAIQWPDIPRVWRQYRLNLVESLLEDAERLQENAQALREIGDELGAERLEATYRQTLETVQRQIRGSFRRAFTPFLTEGRGIPGGERGEELYRAAGVFVTPEQRLAQFGGFARRGIDIAQQFDIPALEKARMIWSLIAEKIDESRESATEVPGAIIQIRSGVEMLLREYINLDEVQRTNLRDTLKFVRELEKAYGALGEVGGLVRVPKFLSPQQQETAHRRNVERLREFYRTPGPTGPRPGTAQIYQERIVDPRSGQTVRNIAHEFKAYGEIIDATGMKVRRFKETQEDLIKAMAERGTLRQAFGRVIRWGTAAGVVYGLVGAFRNMVMTIRDVEMSMAELRKVMDPVGTDFAEMQSTAVEFAKEFGQPINEVIRSMIVFAQQGLKQAEVLDKARASILAANVAEGMNAVQATEALTSAYKQFGDEVTTSIGFLDAWVNVANQHAVSSQNLAAGLMRAGAAAKVAGVSFHELNGLITGIAAVTRQTGKEVGTSLRFIFQRMRSRGGPQALADLGIRVLERTGEVRGAFTVLDELAAKWDNLTGAQQLAVAQAIAGNRQYNALVVAMENWDEVLKATSDSINSKGAAEQRNAIVMETYGKRVIALQAALQGLQLQFGQIALGPAKLVVDSLRTVFEIMAQIPEGTKKAILAFGALTVGLSKLNSVLDTFFTYFQAGQVTGTFGKAVGFFLDPIREFLSEDFGKLGSANFAEMQSGLGKVIAFLSGFGKDFNRTIGNVMMGASRLSDWAAIANPKFLALTGGLAGFGQAFRAIGKESSGLITSLGPLTVAIGSLSVAAGAAKDIYMDWIQTADMFEKATKKEHLAAAQRIRFITQQENVLKSLVRSYERFQQVAAREVIGPEGRVDQELIYDVQERDFKSSITLQRQFLKDYREFSKSLARDNLDMVHSFDSAGRAILRMGSTFEEASGNIQSALAGLNRAAQMAFAERAFERASRFAKDLTETGFGERLKSDLKDLVGAFPLIGKQLEQLIPTRPGFAFQEAREELNRLLELRLPGTTALDATVREQMDALDKAEASMQEALEGFYRNLSEVPKGFDPQFYANQIIRRGLAPAFEQAAAFDELEHTGGQKMARFILNMMGTAARETGKETMAFAREMGITPEIAGEILQNEEIRKAFAVATNDIFVVAQDFVDKWGLATDQIVATVTKTGEVIFTGFKETTEGVIPKTFDLGEIEAVARINFDQVASQMEDNLATVTRRLTGALAGIQETVGMGRPQLDLGPTFRSEIRVETRLEEIAPEATRQFDLNLKTVATLIKNSGQLVDEFNDMSAAAQGASVASARNVEEIKKLQRTVAEQSWILKFVGAVDTLRSSIEEATRAAEQQMVAERTRAQFLTELGGPFAGLPAAPAALGQFGIGRRFTELSAAERRYATEPGFRETLRTVTDQMRQRESIVGRLVQVREGAVGIGFMGEEMRRALERFEQAGRPAETTVGEDRIVAALMDNIEVNKVIATNTGLIAGKTDDISSMSQQAQEIWKRTGGDLAMLADWAQSFEGRGGEVPAREAFFFELRRAMQRGLRPEDVLQGQRLERFRELEERRMPFTARALPTAAAAATFFGIARGGRTAKVAMGGLGALLIDAFADSVREEIGKMDPEETFGAEGRKKILQAIPIPGLEMADELNKYLSALQALTPEQQQRANLIALVDVLDTLGKSAAVGTGAFLAFESTFRDTLDAFDVFKKPGRVLGVKAIERFVRGEKFPGEERIKEAFSGLEESLRADLGIDIGKIFTEAPKGIDVKGMDPLVNEAARQSILLEQIAVNTRGLTEKESARLEEAAERVRKAETPEEREKAMEKLRETYDKLFGQGAAARLMEGQLLGARAGITRRTAFGDLAGVGMGVVGAALVGGRLTQALDERQFRMRTEDMVRQGNIILEALAESFSAAVPDEEMERMERLKAAAAERLKLIEDRTLKGVAETGEIAAEDANRALFEMAKVLIEMIEGVQARLRSVFNPQNMVTIAREINQEIRQSMFQLVQGLETERFGRELAVETGGLFRGVRRFPGALPATRDIGELSPEERAYMRRPAEVRRAVELEQTVETMRSKATELFSRIATEEENLAQIREAITKGQAQGLDEFSRSMVNLRNQEKITELVIEGFTNKLSELRSVIVRDEEAVGNLRAELDFAQQADELAFALANASDALQNTIEAARLARDLQVAPFGALRGRAFPGELEFGPRNIWELSPAQRTFQRAPELYRGAFETQERITATRGEAVRVYEQILDNESKLSRMREMMAEQMAKGTETSRKFAENLRTAASQVSASNDVLRDKFINLKDTINSDTEALSRFLQVLDFRMQIEQLSASFEQAAFDMQKFQYMFDLSTESLDKALGRHPLAPTPPEIFEYRGKQRLEEFGLNRYERELERLKRQYGSELSIPRAERGRVELEKTRDVAIHEQERQNRKLEQQFQMAQNVLDILFEARFRQGVESPEIRDLMERIRFDIERAGEVVGGEYRGFPSLNNLSQALADVQQQTMQQQADLNMSSITNPIVNTLREGFGGVINALGGSLPIPIETPTIRDRGPEEFQTGGFVRGAGGPTSDNIRTQLPEGSFVIRASTVNKFGPEIMDQMFMRGRTTGAGNKMVDVAISPGEYVVPPGMVDVLGQNTLHSFNRGNLQAGGIVQQMSLVQGYPYGGSVYMPDWQRWRYEAITRGTSIPRSRVIDMASITPKAAIDVGALTPRAGTVMPRHVREREEHLRSLAEVRAEFAKERENIIKEQAREEAQGLNELVQAAGLTFPPPATDIPKRTREDFLQALKEKRQIMPKPGVLSETQLESLGYRSLLGEAIEIPEVGISNELRQIRELAGFLGVEGITQENIEEYLRLRSETKIAAANERMVRGVRKPIKTREEEEEERKFLYQADRQHKALELRRAGMRLADPKITNVTGMMRNILKLMTASRAEMLIPPVPGSPAFKTIEEEGRKAREQFDQLSRSSAFTFYLRDRLTELEEGKRPGLRYEAFPGEYAETPLGITTYPRPLKGYLPWSKEWVRPDPSDFREAEDRINIVLSALQDYKDRGNREIIRRYMVEELRRLEKGESIIPEKWRGLERPGMDLPGPVFGTGGAVAAKPFTYGMGSLVQRPYVRMQGGGVLETIKEMLSTSGRAIRGLPGIETAERFYKQPFQDVMSFLEKPKANILEALPGVGGPIAGINALLRGAGRGTIGPEVSAREALDIAGGLTPLETITAALYGTTITGRELKSDPYLSFLPFLTEENLAFTGAIPGIGFGTRATTKALKGTGPILEAFAKATRHVTSGQGRKFLEAAAAGERGLGGSPADFFRMAVAARKRAPNISFELPAGDPLFRTPEAAQKLIGLRPLAESIPEFVRGSGGARALQSVGKFDPEGPFEILETAMQFISSKASPFTLMHEIGHPATGGRFLRRFLTSKAAGEKPKLGTLEYLLEETKASVSGIKEFSKLGFGMRPQDYEVFFTKTLQDISQLRLQKGGSVPSEEMKSFCEAFHGVGTPEFLECMARQAGAEPAPPPPPKKGPGVIERISEKSRGFGEWIQRKLFPKGKEGEFEEGLKAIRKQRRRYGGGEITSAIRSFQNGGFIGTAGVFGPKGLDPEDLMEFIFGPKEHNNNFVFGPQEHCFGGGIKRFQAGGNVTTDDIKSFCEEFHGKGTADALRCIREFSQTTTEPEPAPAPEKGPGILERISEKSRGFGEWIQRKLFPEGEKGEFEEGIEAIRKHRRRYGGGTVRQELLSIPSYHQGTRYVSQTGPAFLAQGEMVLPPDRPALQAGGLVGARESLIDTDAIQNAVQAGIEAGLATMPTSLTLEGVDNGMLKLDTNGLGQATNALGADVFKLQEKGAAVEIKIEDIYNKINNMLTDVPEGEDSRQRVETLKHEMDLLVEELRVKIEEHENSAVNDVHQASTKFAVMQSNIDAFSNSLLTLEARLNSMQGQVDANFAKTIIND